MRAVIVDSPATGVRVATAPPPRRLGAEVLVDVQAAGVHPLDVRMHAEAPTAPGAWIGGHALAGIVAEGAYEAHELQPGDAVFGLANPERGLGAYADRVAVSPLSLARKPPSLSWEQAAALPLAALTAWDAIVRVARAHGGQRILVHVGEDATGHLAVQLGGYLGARVVATAREDGVEALHDLGVRDVVDRDAVRFEEVVAEVDVVLDLAGADEPETGPRSLEALRTGGLYVHARSAPWAERVMAAEAAGIRATDLRAEPDGANLGIVARLVEAGDLRVDVASVHRLDDVAAAFAAAAEHPPRGTVVLGMR